MAQPLDAYREDARPLLVFSPSAEDDAYEEQRLALARDFGGLSERDMAVLLVVGGEPVSVLVGERPETDISADLRKAYAVDRDDFVVVLIGKDGGEKGRWTSPIEPNEIFALIDSMPLRRDEMRETAIDHSR